MNHSRNAGALTSAHLAHRHPIVRYRERQFLGDAEQQEEGPARGRAAMGDQVRVGEEPRGARPGSAHRRACSTSSSRPGGRDPATSGPGRRRVPAFGWPRARVRCPRGGSRRASTASRGCGARRTWRMPSPARRRARAVACTSGVAAAMARPAALARSSIVRPRTGSRGMTSPNPSMLPATSEADQTRAHRYRAVGEPLGQPDQGHRRENDQAQRDAHQVARIAVRPAAVEQEPDHGIRPEPARERKAADRRHDQHADREPQEYAERGDQVADMGRERAGEVNEAEAAAGDEARGAEEGRDADGAPEDEAELAALREGERMALRHRVVREQRQQSGGEGEAAARDAAHVPRRRREHERRGDPPQDARRGESVRRARAGARTTRAPRTARAARRRAPADAPADRARW